MTMAGTTKTTPRVATTYLAYAMVHQFQHHSVVKSERDHRDVWRNMAP
jgi:hypothetical protein